VHTQRMDMESAAVTNDAIQQRLTTSIDTITGLLDDILHSRDNEQPNVKVREAIVRREWWRSKVWSISNGIGAVAFAMLSAYVHDGGALVCEGCDRKLGGVDGWKWALWVMLVFVSNGMATLATYTLTILKRKTLEHVVLRSNKGVIGCCVASVLWCSSSQIILTEESLGQWVLRCSWIILTAGVLWAIKGILVVFLDVKFCPPYRRLKETNILRRETLMHKFLDPDAVKENNANIPAIQGVTCVNAVALQYVSLLRHLLESIRQSCSSIEKTGSDDLLFRIEQLEEELAMLIPDTIKDLAQSANVFLTDESIADWITTIRQTAVVDKGESSRIAMMRRVALKWRRRTRPSVDKARRQSIAMNVGHFARAYVIKTQSIKSMLTDLRMDMLTDANTVVKMPTATESSRPNAIKADDTFAKKLGFFIFWQMKQDMHRISIVPDDLKPFFDTEHESSDAWAALDWSSSGYIDLVDCVQFAKDFFRLRREVACMRLDNRVLLARINQTLACVCYCILALVTLDVFKVAQFTSIWQACSAAIIVFSFIFGNSIRQSWENMIYILSVRAFDVGDTIIVNDSPQHVNRIMLGFVECTALTNTIVNIPMQHFLDHEVVNLTRAVEEWAHISILVDIETTETQLRTVANVVANEIHNRKSLFAGLYRVFLQPSDSLVHKWTMIIKYNLRGNGVDVSERGRAQTYMCIAVARGIAAARINEERPMSRPLSIHRLSNKPVSETIVTTMSSQGCFD
jgi:hypothetical protein